MREELKGLLRQREVLVFAATYVLAVVRTRMGWDGRLLEAKVELFQYNEPPLSLFRFFLLPCNILSLLC